MALPKPNATWPPEHPLREDQKNYMLMYAGIDPLTHVKNAPRLLPDVGGKRPNASARSRDVSANIVADLANVKASLLYGEIPDIEVNHESDVNGLLTPEDAEKSQTQHVSWAEQSGAWNVFRMANELASVAGDSFVRLIADPLNLQHSVIQAVPATDVDFTTLYGELVSARIWAVVGVDGSKVIRWVEERDNAARTIRNGLYVGNDFNLGEQVPLTSHPLTASLPEFQNYPEGVKKMVWQFKNATPSRYYPNLPFGRSDLEGSESLISSLNAAYTAIMRNVRLSQPMLIVPTGSLTRGLNGGGFWDHNREVITDLNLDPMNPNASVKMEQGQVNVSELKIAVEMLVAQIVENAGISPLTVGLGEYGTATSGTALRIREGLTLATISSLRNLTSPQIGSVFENASICERVVFGKDVIPSRPVIGWHDLIVPDPIETARQIQLNVVSGAISIETAVRMAQPKLSDAEVAAEVERIKNDRSSMSTSSAASASSVTGADPAATAGVSLN